MGERIGGNNMKIIIDSSNIMRDAWASLVQVEKGDPAVRMVKDGRDWYQHWPAGKYLIWEQMNRERALSAYSEVSDQFVAKLIKMETIDEAYEAMRRYTI